MEKDVSAVKRPKFQSQADFYDTLKSSVQEYFKHNNIKPTGNRTLYIKATILILLLVFLYVSLVFYRLPVLLEIAGCVLLGVTLGAIGFNIMHDACHDSFSRRPWVNKLFGLSLNLMGGNSDEWRQKHNVFHHTFTNINGVDDDIAIPLIRAHPEQPKRWFHRYQHYYWPAMYSLTYFAWIFIGDFRKYFTGKIGVHPFKMKRSQHWWFWGSKAVYFGLFIVLPIILQGWERFLIGYSMVIVICGFFIAVIFQMAHLVEHTAQPSLVANVVENDWAIHQVETTANFGTKSRILYWLCGGLNFQIEHHLLPRVSHVHYPKLQPLVIKICHAYGVPYNEKRTLLDGLRSHVRTLKKLGM